MRRWPANGGQNNVLGIMRIAPACRIVLLVSVCLLVQLFSALMVTPCHAEDAKVTLIEVQGNKRIETSTILAKIRTHEGDLFSPQQLRDDIKLLYQLGHFDDIQIRTDGFENGLKITFVVSEKPLVRDINFQGNEELTVEKLREGLTLLARTAFNVQLVNENAERIRAKYQDAGFYEAIVIPLITELRGGDRSVVFYIEEGAKVSIADITFDGNDKIPSKEIKAIMKTQEDGFFSAFGRGGALRPEELKEDIEAIRNLYYNKGYIQVQVDDPIIKPNQLTFLECFFWGEPQTFIRRNELKIGVHIKEGDQFSIDSIALKGNALIPLEDLEKELKLKKGEVFSRDVMRQDVARIVDRYDSISRPYASVVPLFNIDQEKKTVAITIDIQEGGEVKIGRIDISGNAKTRDKVIRREMRLDEGDLYSKKAIRRSYERINNLNFFETVDIATDRRLQEPVMDLNVKVKEKLTGNLSVGGGYSSVDKLVGMAEISQGNFMGRGQLLKLKMQVGGTKQIYDLSFMEPYLLDKPVWGRTDIYKQNQKYDGYELKTDGFGFSMGRSFGEYVSTSLKYAFDESLVTNVSTSTPPYALLQQLDEYGLLIKTSAVTWSIMHDSRDFYLDPKTGSRSSLMVQYAGGILKGDPNFIKVIGDSAVYIPVVWDTVFMARMRYGNVYTLIDKRVPLGERFYVGGPDTVRGFRYGAAGPIDALQNRVGGTQELIYNFVFNFPIVPAAHLKGVLFYDIGRAFDDYEKVSLSALRHAYGWGFWWLSPIGPLKFEWGYIVNKRTGDQASEFDFSIGALF